MFHKEHSSVGSSVGKKSVDVALRKSDRRALLQVASQILSKNHAESTSENNNKLQQLLQAAFLQGTLSARKLTHPQLNRVQLYFRSAHPKEENGIWPYSYTMQCVWMTVDLGPSYKPIHCPTIALLAVVLGLQKEGLSTCTNIPTIMVPWPVSKYLTRGANLMRAGMRSLPETTWPGEMVAVCVQGNPQPFCIGRLTSQTTQETIGPDSTGIGVEVWNCLGDDLWRHQLVKSSDDQDLLTLNPAGGAPYDNGYYGNVGFLHENSKFLVVRPIVDVPDDDSEEEEAPEHSASIPSEANDNEEVQQLSEEVTHLSTDESPENVNQALQLDESEKPMDPPDNDRAEDDDESVHDALLHDTVCKALVHVNKSDLPMTTANFYAQHVLKHRPPNSTIQLKLTRWKKIGPYLSEQADRGLIELKPQGTNPVGFVTTINRSHFDLRGISKTASVVPSKKKTAIVNLYLVPHHFVQLLRLDPDDVSAVHAKSEERRGTGMLTLPEVRAISDRYISKNELLVDSGKVQLDGALTDALYKKHTAPPPSTLSRKDFAAKWIEKMEPAYALVEMPGSRITKLGRGSPPKVSIEVALRSGRKYVTRVRGLEEYGIDPHGFTQNVSKRFACAGAVETEVPPGRMALRKGRVECEFQGHLVEELRALLMGDESLTTHGGAKGSEYSLPKGAISVELKKGVPAKKKKK